MMARWFEELDGEAEWGEGREDLRSLGGVELGEEDRGQAARAEPFREREAGAAAREVEERRGTLREVAELSVRCAEGGVQGGATISYGGGLLHGGVRRSGTEGGCV